MASGRTDAREDTGETGEKKVISRTARLMSTAARSDCVQCLSNHGWGRALSCVCRFCQLASWVAARCAWAGWPVDSKSELSFSDDFVPYLAASLAIQRCPDTLLPARILWAKRSTLSKLAAAKAESPRRAGVSPPSNSRSE